MTSRVVRFARIPPWAAAVALAYSAETANEPNKPGGKAMMNSWQFTPARKDGKPCHALIAADMEFTAFGSAPVTYAAKQILRELDKKSPNIVSLEQLDAVPAPISRRPPVFPYTAAVDGTEGSAVIEFSIDKKGDAQLPRIVSCTRDDLGYAAVRAVATWRFRPSLKNGKPTVARTQVPVEFKFK